MKNSYFNTTRSTGAALAEYEGKAKSQEERILAYFAARPARSATPSMVQSDLGMHSTPLTSIRRAMTNLTTQGRLVKLDRQADGPYGRPEHYWTLATGQLRLL